MMNALVAFEENDEVRPEEAAKSVSAHNDVLAWMPIGRADWHIYSPRMLLQELQDGAFALELSQPDTQKTVVASSNCLFRTSRSTQAECAGSPLLRAPPQGTERCGRWPVCPYGLLRDQIKSHVPWSASVARASTVTGNEGSPGSRTGRRSGKNSTVRQYRFEHPVAA